MDSQHNPRQDTPRLHALADGVAAAAAQRSIDLRARTPAEMAMQLTRNATSLELTGSHIPKDEQFYQAVAADLREAAVFLGQWQSTIDALQASHETGRTIAIAKARSDCAGIAAQVRDLVPECATGERAEGWRAAGEAALQTILACNTGVVT